MQPSPCTTIKEMDAAIERYFVSMGRSDYQNEAGIGKFEEYCIESSVDDDEINNDDNYDTEQIEESVFTYFLEEESLNMMQVFPWIENSKDTQPLNIVQKKNQLLALVQKIRRNKNCIFASKPSLQITASHFKEARASIEHVRQIHKRFVPLIFNAADIAGEKAFVKLLAMSHVLHVPYLQYLSDTYARDRLRVRLQHHRELSPVQWVKLNPHCAQLTADGHLDIVLEIQHAITSFYHRVVPKLTLRPSAQVQDSLEQTVEYIIGAIEFVHNLCTANNHTCPFQYDAVIAYLKSADTSGVVKPAMDDDGDMDGDDDGDDDDGKSAAVAAHACTQEIGDIEHKLNGAKCAHKKGAIEAQYTLRDYEKTGTAIADDGVDVEVKTDETLTLRTSRALKQEFDALMNLPAMYKKYGVPEDARFPRQHRFVSMIDRRKPTQNLKMDDVYFYEPPSDCNTIPKQAHLDLWYFDASKKCILPVGHGGGGGGGNITSSTSCDGKMLLLSFHVLSADEIRAYLYLEGGAIRFFADDIVNVLPLYFEQSHKNEVFIRSKTCQDMIERVRKKLKDRRFEAFLEQNEIDHSINAVTNWTE